MRCSDVGLWARAKRAPGLRLRRCKSRVSSDSVSREILEPQRPQRGAAGRGAATWRDVVRGGPVSREGKEFTRGDADDDRDASNDL
jgi:hypothetical protein